MSGINLLTENILTILQIFFYKFPFLFTLVPQEDEEEQKEGVSRVRVTSRRSPHKVERVSGLVTLSHVDIPKVSKAKQKGVS